MKIYWTGFTITAVSIMIGTFNPIPFFLVSATVGVSLMIFDSTRLLINAGEKNDNSE